LVLAAVLVACTPPGVRARVTSISAGETHACAVRADGQAFCWGANDSGQLGDGTTTDSSKARKVVGLQNAVAIAAGLEHTCALKSDHTVACWGLNDVGQLGNDTNDPSRSPVAVSGLTGVVAITSGWNHTCALESDGVAKCWGLGEDGESGNGADTDNTTPQQVANVADFTSLEAGAMHTCGTTPTATYCWGMNGEQGRLGNGLSWTPGDFNTVASYDTPQKVLIDGATDVSAGFLHTCAVRSDQTAACWGWNRFGQVGDGTIADVGVIFDPGFNTPQTVVGLHDAASITTGDSHTCALETSGRVSCWGNNDHGQIGNGTFSATPDPSGIPTPQPVTLLPRSTSLSAGGQYNCALSRGSVFCWGDNEFGQLGNGTTTDADTPSFVRGI
jgi:alpha-tubulin suppressor-like RCC1 family protein